MPVVGHHQPKAAIPGMIGQMTPSPTQKLRKDRYEDLKWGIQEACDFSRRFLASHAGNYRHLLEQYTCMPLHD